MKDIQDLSEKIKSRFAGGKRYLPVLFGLLLFIIYGFLAYRVSTLNNAEPSPDDVTLQTKTVQVPSIDPKVISQLKNLQDNSVSVRALFNQARNNPFNE